MSLELILESWANDDNKDIRGPRDANFFSCDEQYEKDYLADVLEEHYPDLDRGTIEVAIMLCCGIVAGNKPRAEFVECVLNRLFK